MALDQKRAAEEAVLIPFLDHIGIGVWAISTEPDLGG